MALFAFLSQSLPQKLTLSKDKPSLLVELVPDAKTDLNTQKNNRIVETQKTNPSKNFLENSFLGEQNQIVKKEKSRNSVSTIFDPKKIEQKIAKLEKLSQKPSSKQKIHHPNPGALSKFGVSISVAEKVAHQSNSPSNAQASAYQDYSLQAQAKGSYIKGIEGEDAASLLNTREFVFYGYFQRIKDQLQQTWGANLRSYIRHELYKGRMPAATQQDRLTQVLLTLDDKGTVKKVELVGASGAVELDDIAVKSLNDANQFPNPPKGIIGEDNQVVIRWDFLLKT